MGDAKQPQEGGPSEEDTNSSLFDDDDGDDEPAWIPWFCSLKGNEFFCEVDEEFIQDEFNLYGLSSEVACYDRALDMILDAETTEDLSAEQEEAVSMAAETLYGLIHARFIITQRGMQAVKDKFKRCDFGRCPRVYCQGQPTLPIGLSDVPRQNTVKIFCPRCEDVYIPRSARQNGLDGAYFGRSFPYLFFQQYPDLVPPRPSESYVPRVFGFKLHKSALLHAEESEAARRKAAAESKDVLMPTAVGGAVAVGSAVSMAITREGFASSEEEIDGSKPTTARHA